MSEFEIHLIRTDLAAVKRCAVAIGVCTSAIRMWRRGASDPSPENGLALREYLIAASHGPHIPNAVP